ncbi:MAG: VOC family protein [Solirubrobacterales bacterium]
MGARPGRGARLPHGQAGHGGPRRRHGRGAGRLAAKGFSGTIFLTTDDVHAMYDELEGRGVEFVEQPEERPYGIDSAFRDPSGNHIRLTQVREAPGA